MIINGNRLFELSPIANMETTKLRSHGVSYGLTEAGYDIRLKQSVHFTFSKRGCSVRLDDGPDRGGRFTIASAMEEFTMPTGLVGVVHDKSTWAREGLSVFNTVIEPGWKGYLTLELVYHGGQDLFLPKGCGIAQILFSQVMDPSSYDGKYQNQADEPVSAIREY